MRLTGNLWIDIPVGVAAVMAALTGIAAASRVPPFKQVGQVVGFIVRRLVGEPVQHWLDNRLRPVIVDISAERFQEIADQLDTQGRTLVEVVKTQQTDREEWSTALRNIQQAQAPHADGRRGDELGAAR